MGTVIQSPLCNSLPRAAAMRLWWGAGPQPGWRERAAETGQGDFPSSILASSWSKNAGLGGAGLSSEPGLVQGGFVTWADVAQGETWAALKHPRPEGSDRGKAVSLFLGTLLCAGMGP